MAWRGWGTFVVINLNTYRDMSLDLRRSPSRYLWMDSYVLANIVELASQDFCERFLNHHLDPCARLKDQILMAARSVRSNIAEGMARHQTSKETEMRLTDVARGSLIELNADYLNYLMRHGQLAWEIDDERWQAIRALRLEPANYGRNLLRDFTAHILRQKSRFDAWLAVNDAFAMANAMLALGGRLLQILNKQIESQMEVFKQEGGFTESLTVARLEARQNEDPEAPACPKCGTKMVKKTAKKGRNHGHQFWSCPRYPDCNGTRDVFSK